MAEMSSGMLDAAGPKRSDAVRNAQAVLDAAAAVFVESGVNAPVRQIAAKAGVGMATVLRHYPDRLELIAAVYRHQVDECASAAPRLLASAEAPYVALRRWMDLFTEFLTTKHGLASAMASDASGFGALHRYFLEQLLPACESLLAASIAAGEIRADIAPLTILRAVGNLCVGSEQVSREETETIVHLLIDGLSVPGSTTMARSRVSTNPQ
jgi:AcrR family transcriptional regulator